MLRFLLGGILGWAWESVAAPSLPGSIPKLPFRPIYGLGAASAQSSLSANLILSMAFEQLAALRYGDGVLWSYPVDGVLSFNHSVNSRNSALFGLAMTMFRHGADRMGL